MKRPFLTIGPGINGRDRWLAGTGNTILWAWSAPRGLSFRSQGTSVMAIVRRVLGLPFRAIFWIAGIVLVVFALLTAWIEE